MPVTSNGAEMSTEILTQLGEDFTLPDVDLSTSSYALPASAGNPLYTVVDKIQISDLTSGTVDGAGAFDKMMASHKAHLKEEYDKGRITGDQYSKAYIELTTAALSSSVQMLLGQDQAYWQALLVQAQARKAEIEAVTAGVQLETSKAELAMMRHQSVEAEARAVLMKMQTATEEAKYNLTHTQYLQADFTLDSLMPLQRDVLNQESAQASFVTVTMQPLQRDQLQAQIDQTNYTTDQLMPLQRTQLQGQIDTVDYSNTYLQPLQKSQLEEQIGQIQYTVGSFLPAQKKLVDEQTEAKRAETLDTRSDFASVAGSIGKQKELYDQQIDTYKKDAAYKVGKLYSDSFITQLTIDETTNAPDQFTKPHIEQVISALRTGVNL